MDSAQLFGRGMAFPPRVGADGRVAWSSGEENVREHLRIILLTEPGERLMAPEFGGGLRRFLFRPNTVATRHQISERIQKAVARHEPRIRLESVEVAADPDDPAAAVATIAYQLVATQARDSLTLRVPLGS